LSRNTIHTALLEPTWHALGRRRPAGVPEAVFGWLNDRGSLTRRLIDTCPERFRVKLCRQEWGPPFTGERRLLGVRQARFALLREVELHCGGSPWVFARSVIPRGTLRGGGRRFALLGERPLGAMLFSHPGTRRDLTQIARLLPQHPLFATASVALADKPDELWARRTLFFYAERPLLVNEVFLPEIVHV
jgi:chorismate--pyruvate lyase